MSETESSRETFRSQSPEQLAVALGFVETSELLDLRTAIVLEYAIDPERAIELKAIYEQMAEDVIDDRGPGQYQRMDAHIGLILMCASMRLYAGSAGDYNSELGQAELYACYSGDNALADQISSMRLQ